MDPSSPIADLTAFYIQEIGALLFGMVFLFLYRQSRVVYFGLWAIAWVLRLLAALFGFELLRTRHSGWLAPYATFEFAFAIVLIAAARAGFASEHERLAHGAAADLHSADLRGAGLGHRAVFAAWRPTTPRTRVVLGFVYFYNFCTLRKSTGLGARVFRFSLLVLAAAFLEHA